MEKANLSADPAKTAHAQVSVAAMSERLEDLEAVAHDPGKVKAWVRKLWRDLGKCRVC